MKLNWRKLGVLIGATAVLLLAIAAIALSQAPQGPPRGGPGRDGLGPFARDLNLTDDQKAQIKAINESFRQSDKPLHEQLRALYQSQPDPMSGTFDEAAVRAAAEARAKIEIELEVSHAKMMSQIANVLTSDQKAQLAAKRAQFQRQGPPPPPPDRP